MNIKYAMIVAAAAVAVSACGGSSKSETAVEELGISETVSADSCYSSETTERIIGLSKQGELSQEDYAVAIGQCAAINKLLMQKLASISFKEDMTDQELQAAVDKLENDPELPKLESQNKQLLEILQKAHLDRENTRKYNAMVEQVRLGLGAI